MIRSLRTLSLLLQVVACLLPSNVLLVAAGDLATFTEAQMTGNITYRQDLCDLYRLVVNPEVSLELKDALSGLQLNVLMADYTGAYFNYDEETGIDPLNPGLQAVLLDELARRAGFTWRESFGVFKDPTEETWDELLEWSTNVYDVSIDWWATSLARINSGIAFLTPWYDSSVILVKRELPPEISNEVKWWNWLRPFEPSVWYLSIVTILLSGLVFQWLEYLSNDRRDRSMWEWFNENAYLSIINFTQASYEYKPKNVSGRIFGASMALWALVMTATYTANLASLLVDRKAPAPEIYTLAEAAHYGFKICTINGYVSDSYIASAYPSAQRLPLNNVVELYEALHRGDCEFAADTAASWNSKVGDRTFNPTCDLTWVGGDRKVLQSGAGFAIKADSGYKCTGLIRDVVNYHMEEMIRDGFVDIAWSQENRADECASYRPDLEFFNGGEEEEPATRRLKSQLAVSRASTTRRGLKGSNRSGAAAGGVQATEVEVESTALTYEQMLGTFIFHWLMMVVAVGSAFGTKFHNRYVKRHALKALNKIEETVLETTHLDQIAEKTVGLGATLVSKIDKTLGGDSSHDKSNKLEKSERLDKTERLDESERTMLVSSVPGHPPVLRRETTGATLSSSVTNSDQGYLNVLLAEQTDTGLMNEVRIELAAMRKSQLEAQQLMQDMHRQMLLEQWRLQEQIQVLTAQQASSPVTPPVTPTALSLPFASPPSPSGASTQQASSLATPSVAREALPSRGTESFENEHSTQTNDQQ